MIYDQDAPSEDIIDKALLDIIHEIVGEGAHEDDFDGASDVVFEIVEELVSTDEIKELPENEESNEVKQQWLDSYLSILKEALKEALHDGFDGEPGEEGLSI